jgi:hypothetical protein
MLGVLKKTLLAAAAFIITFALIEGLASEALLGYQLFLKPKPPLAERLHTRYDPEIGWVAIPNLYIHDMYGPGLSFRSNAQGFRNDHTFEGNPPPGKIRAICAGDSFTLGYGVDDDHPWCQLLSKLDSRFETVNMGQGGYGIDQAYLWYRRDGAPLSHQLVIFAFVTADFNRMQRDSFLNYGKPLLKVRDGQLVVENVPVPKSAFRFSWFVTNLPLFEDLRLVKFAGGVREQFAARVAGLKSKPPSEEATRLSAAIFAALRDLGRQAGAVPVLVYLPNQSDYDGTPLTDQWRGIVGRQANELGISFIDIVDDFQKMPRNLGALFIPPNRLRFGEASGHYTAKGNEVMAKALYDKLLVLPEVAAKLSAAGRSGHS